MKTLKVLIEELSEAVMYAVTKSIDEHKRDSVSPEEGDEDLGLSETFFDEEVLLDLIRERVTEGIDEVLTSAIEDGDINAN